MSKQTDNEEDGMPKQTGIQSVELGFRLISLLMQAGGALSLTELSRSSGMSTSKARGYLISFVRLGIVQQRGDGGLYDLGPTAVRLGLAAMGRINALACVRAELSALRTAIQETVCLCVWGDFGPVVVDKLDGVQNTPFELRLGTSVPLLTTATGHTFMAWLPPERYSDLLRRESGGDLRVGSKQKVNLDRILKAVRRDGCAAVSDVELPGFGSVAVPLLDHRGELIATVNAIGPSSRFDVTVNGSAANELRRFAQYVGEQCGVPAAV
ncbi:Transcriptional repressor IclR [Paraburkholderia aspalathi]|uniref:Transcriptional repressor IclR n=2 Tax=Paraburkholderia aspalathi TaxID=1324617 RepID=A0ABM8T4U3_9BURK|nr:IclR family transcriptional regulator [Paraburkholderia aspalathi]CAE6858363.1 Transcriptional repressor IclR [Paraburkholderia aspalathi]